MNTVPGRDDCVGPGLAQTRGFSQVVVGTDQRIAEELRAIQVDVQALARIQAAEIALADLFDAALMGKVPGAAFRALQALFEGKIDPELVVEDIRKPLLEEKHAFHQDHARTLDAHFRLGHSVR
jgi:hypothetical protein